MNKEPELWQFILDRLARGENVMLLVVAESSGSSPGRRGYKMAVGADGQLIGSIGGGVMEVNLVVQSRALLSEPGAVATGFPLEQVHRKDATNSSGMICSGKQTVIFKLLTRDDATVVDSIIDALNARAGANLRITPEDFRLIPGENPPATAGGTDKSTPSAQAGAPPVQEGSLTKQPAAPENPKSKIQNPKSEDFQYTETLGFKNDLYIVGGGHCALALSELMSKMDFHISLFDDRPELNTIEKNRYAHEIKIIDGYDKVGDYVVPGEQSYVVVMTLGYVSDGQAIRSLIYKDFKYFGVLGSNAKMATMLRELVKEGLPREMLDRIRTPVGLLINSRTPEEIAVSIAAEIISVKNAE